MTVVSELESYCQIVQLVHKAVCRLIYGRRVVLRLSDGAKYNGRVGVIDAIMMDSTEGILALVMVLRDQPVNDQDFLNSDPETRQYRPLSEFIFIDGK